MLLAIMRDETVIRLESRHLKIESKGAGAISGVVPLCNLDRVVVDSRSQLSGAVVEVLMTRGIPIIFLSRQGCAGMFHPSVTSDVERRRRQYRFDAERDPVPAIRLIEAKLHNQKRVLQRLGAARGGRCAEVAEIHRLMKQLMRCSDLAELRGIEGMAAVKYFQALRDFLPVWCAFSGRRRRPPSDPFNALLSYCYTVMAGELESLIRLHGLDPAAGFLHGDRYNSSPLTYDLLEPLRPGFCDMLAIGLLTHRRLRSEHFAYSENRVEMTAVGRRIFFDAWERKRAGGLRGDAGVAMGWPSIWDSQVTDWLAFLMEGRKPSFFRMP